jgi:predicted transcriptional regulator
LTLSILENGSRILAYINDHPGCYLRQIKKDLELSMGTMQYHLNYLIKSNRITYVRRGLRKNYFINGVFVSPNGFNLLQVLNQETVLKFDTPYADVILASMTLGILVSFLIFIIKKERPKLIDQF